MRLLTSAFAALLAICFAGSVQGFVSSHQGVLRPFTASPLQAEADSSNWLDEFRLFNGELVDPYDVLKVTKRAERQEIRRKYISLSKRYHPDAFMHRDILPGRCNDEDDVRLHWERIKLSYEILSNRKMRARYDRHLVVADPQTAMKKAAIDAAGGAAVGVASYVGKGVFAMGKGLFSMGAKAVESSMNKNEKESSKKDA